MTTPNPQTLRDQIRQLPAPRQPIVLAAFAVAFTGTPAADEALDAAVALLEAAAAVEAPEIDYEEGGIALPEWTSGAAALWPLLTPAQHQRLIGTLLALDGLPMPDDLGGEVVDETRQERYAAGLVALLIIDLLDHLDAAAHPPVFAALAPLLEPGFSFGDHWIAPLDRLVACAPAVADDPALMARIAGMDDRDRDDMLHLLIQTLVRHRAWARAWAVTEGMGSAAWRGSIRALLLRQAEEPVRGALLQMFLAEPLTAGDFAGETRHRAVTAAHIVARGVPSPQALTLLAQAVELYGIAEAQQATAQAAFAEQRAALDAQRAALALALALEDATP